jgi:hypothetical protein
VIGLAYCPDCRELTYGLQAALLAHRCSDGEERRLEVFWVRTVRSVSRFRDVGDATRLSRQLVDAIAREVAARLVRDNRRVTELWLPKATVGQLFGDEGVGAGIIATPAGQVRIVEERYLPERHGVFRFADGSFEMLGPGWEVGP